MTVLLVAKRDGTVKTRVDLGDRRKLTVGRSARCDLTLRSPSISRRHALLFEHDGAWHIVDTGAKTGIFRGRTRNHHLVLERTQWVRLGPAYLWLDDARSNGSDVRMERPEERMLDPGRALEGFDHALAGEAGMTREIVEGGESEEGPTIVIADAAAGSLQRFSLAGSEMLTVGRSTACNIVIHDSGVQPLHCVLYTEHAGWCVANAADDPKGTRVDGRPTWRRKLTEERLVRIGGSVLWLVGAESQTAEGQDDPDASEVESASDAAEVGESVFFDDPADTVEESAEQPPSGVQSAFVDPGEPLLGASETAGGKSGSERPADEICPDDPVPPGSPPASEPRRPG